MSQFHESNLRPLSEGEPVWGVLPAKMSNGSHLTDDELKALQDEAYATPRGILSGAFWGFIGWGVLFAIAYAVMRFF